MAAPMTRTRRLYARQEAQAALERAAARRAILGERPQPHPVLDAPIDAAGPFTLTASQGNGYDWFDLEEVQGLGAAMERAAAWRQDERLEAHAITVYAGKRSDHGLCAVGTLAELV